MSTFFILNSSDETVLPDVKSDFVIFYKKSKEEAQANIQNELFSKLIINALKLKLEDFLFVDISKPFMRFAAIHKNITIKKCFLFGVSEKEVGINFDIPMYNLLSINDIDFIKADTAEKLEADKQLKSQLWNQLVLTFKL